MFIVTIPCDSHKRLEKSTSTLPPHHCTIPTRRTLPQSLKAQLKKKREKEGGWGGVEKKKKRSKFVVRRSRIVVLSARYRLRSLLDKHSVVLRRNKEQQKTPAYRWRVGVCARVRACVCAKREETAQRLQGGMQFVCYSCFFFSLLPLVAKIIQKPSRYWRDVGKRDTCFLLSVITCVFSCAP